MAFENISGAVLDSARAEADHVLKAAKKAAEDKFKAGCHAAELEGERRKQAAIRAIEEEFARKLIQFNGTANKDVLAAKNECLKRIFTVARDVILAMPEKDYMAVMQRRLENAAGSESGRLRVHADDKARFTAMLAAFNANRPADAQVTLDETAALSERGGFFLVCREYEVNQTLSASLTELERELAPQLAAELFKS